MWITCELSTKLSTLKTPFKVLKMADFLKLSTLSTPPTTTTIINNKYIYLYKRVRAREKKLVYIFPKCLIRKFSKYMCKNYFIFLIIFFKFPKILVYNF